MDTVHAAQGVRRRPLDVPVVEDAPADARLLVHELDRAGFDPRPRVVQTEGDYRDELRSAPR